MNVNDMKEAIERLHKLERHDADAPNLPAQTLIDLDRYVRQCIIDESNGLFNTAERIILQDFYENSLWQEATI